MAISPASRSVLRTHLMCASKNAAAASGGRAPGPAGRGSGGRRASGQGPRQLSSGSNQLVLWACSDCNGRWTATVASRVRAGRGCPSCARAIRGTSRAAVARGRASAADKAPHLLGEFIANHTRPGLDLTQVLPATRDRCSWRCAVCTHEWMSSVANRVSGRGCPSCAQRLTVGAQGRPVARPADGIRSLAAAGGGVVSRTSTPRGGVMSPTRPDHGARDLDYSISGPVTAGALLPRGRDQLTGCHTEVLSGGANAQQPPRGVRICLKHGGADLAPATSRGPTAPQAAPAGTAWVR